MEEFLTCPFCGGRVHIQVCDGEGNFHDEEYENDPWSGLSYALIHEDKDIPEGKKCPIAFSDGDQQPLGNQLYDTREEAKCAWLGANNK